MLIPLLQSLQTSLQGPLVRGCIMILIFLLTIFIMVTIYYGNVHKTRRRLKHLQKLGTITSNMADQYDPSFGLASETEVDGPARIKAIYIHPVKSCAPVEVDRALLTKSGFLYDRCFALATKPTKKSDAAEARWRFISQRTKPAMSQVKTELWLPHKHSNLKDPLVRSGGCVVGTFDDPSPPSWADRVETFYNTWDLSARPRLSFILPLNPDQAEESQPDLTTFGIHSRDAKGIDVGRIPSIAAALPKLKQFLGIPGDQHLTIFKCTPDTLTRTNKNLAPLQHIGSPAVHGYTDQQPININSLSSVHAVSRLLPPENQPLNALRFRANIWITNTPAYEEETWKRYRILPKSRGTEARARVPPVLSVVCRTSRCTLPNVNPETGIFDADTPAPEKKRGKPQPSTTLVQYRTVESGNRAALGYLGMHCVPEDRELKEAAEREGGLYVEVGDEIEVLERGIHLYGSTGDDY